jgi:hypothetical protein
MATTNVMSRFWIAVLAAVVALGIAWGNWKDPAKTPGSVAVAVLATIAFVCSLLVASRFVFVLARATRRTNATPTRNSRHD